jgi:hypothetical protein
MNSKQVGLSESAFDAFCQQVLNGAVCCADSQILALADELHDIIRGRRMARWQASAEARSFDPVAEGARG